MAEFYVIFYSLSSNNTTQMFHEIHSISAAVSEFGQTFYADISRECNHRDWRNLSPKPAGRNYHQGTPPCLFVK